jgi:hypothetical protein
MYEFGVSSSMCAYLMLFVTKARRNVRKERLRNVHAMEARQA